MTKYQIIAYILSIALFYSCNDRDNNSIEINSVPINLEIESTFEFKAGDAIGLFVEQRRSQNSPSVIGTESYTANLKWIYQENGIWIPDSPEDIIYTPSNGILLDLYAYYPYSNQATTDEINISSATNIMTGASFNVNNIDAKLTLNSKTALVKVILPNVDILSSVEVTMTDVFIGGTLYPAKLGKEDDFFASNTMSTQSLSFRNGYYIAYLPEQIFNENKSLLEIKDGDNKLIYRMQEDLQVRKDKENVVVFNKAISDNLADLANTFMLSAGDELFISVQKAYKIWQSDPLLVSLLPDLSGEISAEIVWQEDFDGVIESVAVINEGEDGLIHVRTKSNKIGNATVGVKIGETIRWSWQLWVSDYNPSDSKTGSIYEYNGLNFMDRNLGATGNPKYGGSRTFGLYYQWGRKDPFSTRGEVRTITVENEASTNLANSIIYPDIYIASSSGRNDWYVRTGNLGLDRWGNVENKKSPFDPCPKGWRVASTNNEIESPWEDLTIPTDQNKWGNGWYFEEDHIIGYYPAAGQRTINGTTTYAGSAGFYYSARPDATMMIDFSSVNLSFGGGRASARSIRCIKDNLK